MQTDSYLHDQKDFRDLIRVVSNERRILPQLIEKDYWIMHVLYGLAKQGFVFELKGGTSKEQRFRKEDVRCISENQAFLLQDSAIYQLYTSEYAKTEGLYYAGMVPFDAILKRIRESFDRL